MFNKINKDKIGIVCEDTTNIFFPDNSFDYVISHSVFHYFPNLEYSDKVIKEMMRIAKKGIGIYYVRNEDSKTFQKQHLIHTDEFFNKYNFTKSFMDMDKDYICHYSLIF